MLIAHFHRTLLNSEFSLSCLSLTFHFVFLTQVLTNVHTFMPAHKHTARHSCPSFAYCVKKNLHQGNHSQPLFRLPGRSRYLFKLSRPLFKPCLDFKWKVASLNPNMVQQPHWKKNVWLIHTAVEVLQSKSLTSICYSKQQKSV